LRDISIGVGITGSFCCFADIIPVIERLARDNKVMPVLSFNAASMDTRFYRAEDFKNTLRRITGNEPITTIQGAEQVGPKKMFDIMLIAPCTGNTMAKLNLGITDTPVLMAAKASLRNGVPIVLAPSTNDALGASAQNIAALLNRKNVYFVPFSQDDPIKKPRSMVARFGLCDKALDQALNGDQIQPIIM